MSCRGKYGRARDFHLCVEQTTYCEFYARTQWATCSEQCIQYGGTCIQGWNNAGTCGKGLRFGCYASLLTQICRCTR